MLDPQITQILNTNKAELQRLQEEKDSAIEEFLDNLMEIKVQKQKQIEGEFKLKVETQHEDSIEIERTENDDTTQTTKDEPTLEDRLSQLKEETAEKKRIGLNELKSKYNQLSLQIKLDSK